MVVLMMFDCCMGHWAFFLVATFNIIRIVHGCEVRIENSATRVHVTVRQASWCRTVIPNESIFNSHQTTTIYFFFIHTLPLAWICVIYLILCWGKYVFDQQWFDSAPFYDVLTSCTRSSYTPGIRRYYPEGWKSRNTLSGMQEKFWSVWH